MESVFVTNYQNLFKNKNKFRQDVIFFLEELSKDFELPCNILENKENIEGFQLYFIRQKYEILVKSYLDNENNFIDLLTDFCYLNF